MLNTEYNPLSKYKHNFFESHFFLSNIIKTNTLKFIPPTSHFVYNYPNPKRTSTYIASFQDKLNLLCYCGNDAEFTENFLLHCPQFVNKRALFWVLQETLISFLENNSTDMKQTLLFLNMSLILSA